MIRHLIVLFLILLTNFSFGQREVILRQTHADAKKGIDRKDWSRRSGDVSGHSAGYANDFTLPARTNPFEKITDVKVEINITKYSNISCPISLTYFNVFYGCTPYAGGATCLKIPNLIAEPNYPPTTSGATLNFNTCVPKFSNLDFGGNLSVDIIPVSNPCHPVLNGGLTYEYTIKVTVTTTDTPLKLEIMNPAPVSSGGTVDIKLPAITAGSTTGTTLTYWTDAAATIWLPNPSAITTSDTYYIKSTLASCSIIKPVLVTIAPPIVLPVVTTPVYLCQNKPTTPLTATPSGGGTLNWYTVLTGGVALPGAPTPSTTTLGSTTYYVTETILGVESTPRTPLVVNVVADNGQIANIFRCDATQVTTATSVFFDWSHVVGRTVNSYNYSYSIQGGPPVFGNTPLSGQEVFGLLPGQTAAFTILTVMGLPCYPTQTIQCSLPCITTTTPIFSTTPTSYCLNDVVVLPTTSTNSITGTWSPSLVDTSTMGTKIYTFIPDPILFPCALKTNSLSISIGPIEPDFTGFSICSGDPTSSLSNVSTNGITGIWSPTDIVDSSVLGIGTFPFTFIPDLGQSCTPSNKTINVTVNPSSVILSLNWTVTEAFSKNQIVTVTDPLGSNYLYQMDFGPFQTSPVFENVASGLHSISVKHVNGCSEFTENNVLIIGYPKFFTPNGDGYNDTWNIPGLKDQLNSRIHIFDRYGKLLKDISPNDPGWDGTYIGQPMPADDYWFNVEYIENAVLKKFKSHFSLKR